MAATTRGKYSGRQPAMTALTAALSAVTTVLRLRVSPRSLAARQPAPASPGAVRLVGRRHHRKPVGVARGEVRLDQRGGIGGLGAAHAPEDSTLAIGVRRRLPGVAAPGSPRDRATCGRPPRRAAGAAGPVAAELPGA